MIGFPVLALALLHALASLPYNVLADAAERFEAEDPAGVVRIRVADQGDDAAG